MACETWGRCLVALRDLARRGEDALADLCEEQCDEAVLPAGPLGACDAWAVFVKRLKAWPDVGGPAGAAHSWHGPIQDAGPVGDISGGEPERHHLPTLCISKNLPWGGLGDGTCAPDCTDAALMHVPAVAAKDTVDAGVEVRESGLSGEHSGPAGVHVVFTVACGLGLGLLCIIFKRAEDLSGCARWPGLRDLGCRLGRGLGRGDRRSTVWGPW